MSDLAQIVSVDGDGALALESTAAWMSKRRATKYSFAMGHMGGRSGAAVGGVGRGGARQRHEDSAAKFKDVGRRNAQYFA